MKKKHVAIVLSAGKGKRMGSSVSKQYLPIGGKPVIYYSLKAFEDCPFIDEIILVTGKEDIAYCRHEIVEKYDFAKVTAVIEGGAERYFSVYQGLCAIDACDYVYIHDGARPFLSQEILMRVHDGVTVHQACVVGMPVKDTIKISDEEGFAESTPDRSKIWQVQTPQVFSFPLVKNAYEKLKKELEVNQELSITDDAMVVERYTDQKVKLIEGAYTNIKITTPEDLKLAESFLN